MEIKTQAKIAERFKDLSSVITTELKGSEKQVKYARDILVHAIVDVFDKNTNSIARGKGVIVVIDEKIVQALNMFSDAGYIISKKAQFDWASNQKMCELVEVREA